MFSDAVLDPIFQRYAEFNGKNAPLTEAQIYDCIRFVFYASLRFEEGAPVLPRVKLAPSSEEFDSKYAPSLTFGEKHHLSVEWLRKHALAVDADTSALAVVPEGDCLLVLSIHHDHWNPTHRTPITNARCLTVRATSPGVLQISVGDNRIGTLRDGVLTESRSPVFVNQNFVQGISGLFSWISLTAQKREWIKHSLEEVVSRSASHGRGGTILMIADSELQTAMRSVETMRPVDMKYLTNGQSGIQQGYRDHVLIPPHDGVALTPQRRRYLQFCSNLTRVDGALVMNMDFKPLGFAAKLKADPYKGDLLLGGDSSNIEQAGIQNVGTRHTSAINFVAATPKTLAFVVSADGPTTALMHIDRRVAVWRNALG
jgi:hypothetical protein